MIVGGVTSLTVTTLLHVELQLTLPIVSIKVYEVLQVRDDVTVTHCWLAAPLIVPPVPEIVQAYPAAPAGAQCTVVAEGQTVDGPSIEHVGAMQQLGAVPAIFNGLQYVPVPDGVKVIL